jgi:hypothetical protein
MPRVIDDELLDRIRRVSTAEVLQNPRLARFWVQAFGRLARWWLRPEILKAAGCGDLAVRDCSSVPSNVGACWIVLVQEATGSFPILRDAMLPPLEWTRGRGLSLQLPPGLGRLAEEALCQVREENGFTANSPQDWGLALSSAAELDNHDLSGLRRFRFESGYASLAAGLISAAEGAARIRAFGRPWRAAPTDGATLRERRANSTSPPSWKRDRFFYVRPNTRTFEDGSHPTRRLGRSLPRCN